MIKYYKMLAGVIKKYYLCIRKGNKNSYTDDNNESTSW